MCDRGLRIADLRCSIAGKEILKGIDLFYRTGRVARAHGSERQRQVDPRLLADRASAI